MSTEILGRVWKLKLPSTPKFVLVSLADQANDNGVCWPAVGSIAKRTGFTDRAIQKSLVWLENCKYIKREERKGRSTYYTVTPELGSPLVPNDVHPAPDSPTSERPSGEGEPRSPQGEPRSPITITQPPPNPQGTISAPPALFARFWQAYPIKKSKGRAEKAWKKLKPDAELVDRMLAAIEAQHEERKAKTQRGEFVPEWKYPEAWLNASCWLDEVTPAAAATVKSPADKLQDELNQARQTQRNYGLRPQMTGEPPENFVARIQREASDAHMEKLRADQKKSSPWQVPA